MDRKIRNKSNHTFQDTEAEAHFYSLFTNAPVALLEIDYSAIVNYLEQNRTQFGDNPEKYFFQRPEMCKKILNLRIIKEANKNALELFKVSNIKDLRIILTKSYLQTNLHELSKILIYILQEKKLLNYELKIIDTLGKEHIANVRFSTNTTDYSKTFIAFFDISAIRKKQDDLQKNKEKITQDLRYSEARYRQLTALYPIGVFHTDRNGQMIYSNNKAKELQNIFPQTNEFYDWTKHLHPEDYDLVMKKWERSIQYGIPFSLEFRFSKNSNITWVNMQTVPEYDQNEKIVGFISILVDNTRQRETEAYIKENQIEIAHFSRLNSMGEVASGIAHELNQPLTAIINYISGCKHRLQEFKKTIPKEIFEAIDNTIIQAERAGKIIHHLKDFLRKGKLNKKGFAINTAIKDVISFIDKYIMQNHIEIELQLSNTLPVLHADKIHIEQVVLNIITNAIEAFAEIKTGHRTITISTTQYQTNFVKIDIQDNGPGIDMTIIDSIFNPFITTKEHGMGIGLSLCYSIVNEHNGKISVSSKVNHGTIFSIILPFK